VPLWVVLLRLIDRDRVPRRTLAGVAVGFSGLALLVLPGDRPGHAPLAAMLVIVLASISWAAGSFYSKRMDLPADTLVSTAFQMLLGGGAMIAVALAAGEGAEVDLGAFSTRSALAFAYLIVAGSLLAFTAYTWLLQNAPISTVATYAYVNPVIAVILGALILSEEVTATVALGAAAIVLSVAAVVRRESQPDPTGPMSFNPPTGLAGEVAGKGSSEHPRARRQR
jgi:drug/metabolite transporter (DMT)-like permease